MHVTDAPRGREERGDPQQRQHEVMVPAGRPDAETRRGRPFSRPRLRLSLLAALLTVATLTLASCGMQGSSAQADGAGTGAQQSEAATGSVTSTGSQRTKLVLGIPPGEAGADWLKRNQPIADQIAKATGLPVEVKTASDYPAVAEAMRAGQVDLASFSPFVHLMAVEVAGAKALAVGKGAPYYSIIVTRADSGINSLADLKGHSFAFVDPGSTSGNFIPRLMLKEAGIDPDKDVSATFAGGHDAVEFAITNGHVDAGADATLTYDRMVKEGQVDPQVNRIIAKSDLIPISIVIDASPNLEPELAAKIQKAFTENVDPAVLDIFGIKEFTVPTEADFDIFRRAVDELNLDLTQMH